MAQEKVLKLYDQTVLVPLDSYDESLDIPFAVFTGSRILMTIYVKSRTVGSTLRAEVLNSFSTDDRIPFQPTLDIAVEDGWTKKAITDFNKFFKLKLTVVGEVEYTVSFSVFDNAQTQKVEGGEILDNLNKLVPEVYDDVEVLTFTPGKQPIDVEFRRKGQVVRSLRLTYNGEVFVRARIV